MPSNEPETKKLRSCEADLKVVLGGGASEDDVRWHNSAILASKSCYIDTMLATPMKESQERQVTFPEITPELWDNMLKFVQDPKAARKMTMADALAVLPMYDKYQFNEGKELCEDVMEEYFKETIEKEKKIPPDVDAMVEGTALAFEANLSRALLAGSNYIRMRLCQKSVPYGRTMFTEEHMRRLVPLLLHLNEGHRMMAVHQRFPYAPDEIQKPDFPQRHVRECTEWIANHTLHGFIDHIELSDTHGKPDGTYTKVSPHCSDYVRDDGEMNWGGIEVNIVIKKTEDGWAIVRETIPTFDEDGDEEEGSRVTSVCWLHPSSKNLPLPPMEGWRAIDKACYERHTPKIEYKLRKYGEMMGI